LRDGEADPIRAAAGLVKRGEIIAIKGLGAYHLVSRRS
jgi:hydrogenase maturation factor HypF (carbamoyltransferase family)